MALDDVKTRAVEYVQNQWTEFQETSVYINIKEKYDNLSNPLQKLALIGAGFFLLLLVLLPPLLWWSSSNSFVDDFEEKRAMLRDLLYLRRDIAADTGGAGLQITSNEIKIKVAAVLESANLLPEQVTENFDLQIPPQKDSQLIPATFTQHGVKVTLNKLNLRQIVDLSYRFQTLAPMVKIPHFEAVATPEDSHYYRASWQIVAFEMAGGSGPGGLPGIAPGGNLDGAGKAPGQPPKTDKKPSAAPDRGRADKSGKSEDL